MQKKKSGSICFRSSSLWIRLLLQHIQHERQDDERSADPLGGTRKTGIRALGLVLGHKGIGNAADRTAQAGRLAALEENDADDDQAAEELKNRDE